MVEKISSLIPPIINMPRTAKQFFVAFIDICICVIAAWLAFYLRLDEFVNVSEMPALTAAGLSVIIAIPIFYFHGLYNVVLRHGGWPTFLIVRSFVIYWLFYFSIFTVISFPGVPRTIGIIQPILLLFFLGLSRILAYSWLDEKVFKGKEKRNPSGILIYGAGSSGRQISMAISRNTELEVKGFLDDDKNLQGRILNKLTIYDPGDLAILTKKLNIKHVLLSMPSISRKRKNEILNQIQQAQVSVRTLPSFSDLAQGKVKISDLKELDIDDLLGRESVIPDQMLLAKNITGKIVMVTGAGGSIGSELCRQIIDLNPKKLLLVEQGEFGLYDLHQQLENNKSDIPVIPLLASVKDADRMNELFFTWHPNTVYHAAAYKHVPLVEHNLSEGIKNNVLGTLVTARAAITHKVESFVLISTDKAVRPTNIMGASKRLAEMVLQALAAENSFTKLSMVRFGNVLGSSGSVVPKFRQQIKDGGPITITHPEITRFFMTIPEASQLVIQAGAMARGGDVFVLDMGEPVKIINLAERMVELSGLSVKNEQNPDGDIEIQITQLRPGEKLYEELLIGKNPQPTSHRRIMKAHEPFLGWDKLEDEIETLTASLNTNDISLVRHLLEKLVTDYQPNKDILDWVYLEREQIEVMH